MRRILAYCCLWAVAPVGCGGGADAADAATGVDAGAGVDAIGADARPPGRLAGAVSPLGGEATVRLVQVHTGADPSTPTGYGQRVEGGDCLEVPALAFDGTWERRSATGAPRGRDTTADAGVGDDDPDCATLTFDTGAVITAGAHPDLYGAGAAAWVAHAADHALPGEILYVEAYFDFFEGDTVVVEAFENWFEECAACVFFATGCDEYEVPVNDGIPMAPVGCDTVFMLDRGVVTFTSRDGP